MHVLVRIAVSGGLVASVVVGCNDDSVDAVAIGSDSGTGDAIAVDGSRDAPESTDGSAGDALSDAGTPDGAVVDGGCSGAIDAGDPNAAFVKCMAQSHALAADQAHGSGQLARLNDTTPITLGAGNGTGNFTVEAWARVSSTSPAGVNTLAIASTNEMFFGVCRSATFCQSPLTAGTPFVEIQNPTPPTSKIVPTAAVDLRDDKWHHLAMTRQGSTYTLYLDGAAIGNASSATVTMHTASTLQAGFFVQGEPTPSALHSVRVWSVLRTVPEIRESRFLASPTVTTGLTAFWRMNQATGQAVPDELAAHNGVLGSTTGIDSNDPAWIPLP
jgi:hypothetical protein